MCASDTLSTNFCTISNKLSKKIAIFIPERERGREGVREKGEGGGGLGGWGCSNKYGLYAIDYGL